MPFIDDRTRRADEILAATIMIFRTPGEVEAGLEDVEDLRPLKVPKAVAAAVQVLRERLVEPPAPACGKCASAMRTLAFVPRFVHRPDFTGGPLPEPLPRVVCRYGECPDGEHLHVMCATCGFAAVAPVVGGPLGPPLPMPSSMLTDAAARASAWDYLFGRRRG